MSVSRSAQVAGGVVMPALVNLSLLYQKPTTPRLNGTPYTLPSLIHPAPVAPMVEIHGLVAAVRSWILPALMNASSLPPPLLWMMSGGLLDSRPSDSLVSSCSFWIGWILKVTFGCSLV